VLSRIFQEFQHPFIYRFGLYQRQIVTRAFYHFRFYLRSNGAEPLSAVKNTKKIAVTRSIINSERQLRYDHSYYFNDTTF
jgi:hypothetical protein